MKSECLTGREGDETGGEGRVELAHLLDDDTVECYIGTTHRSLFYLCCNDKTIVLI